MQPASRLPKMFGFVYDGVGTLGLAGLQKPHVQDSVLVQTPHSMRDRAAPQKSFACPPGYFHGVQTVPEQLASRSIQGLRSLEMQAESHSRVF